MATNQVANLAVKVDPRGAVTGANKAKRAITGIGNSARKVKKRIFSLQGALVGLGAGAVLKSIITTASSVESLRVRLKFLTGSTEKAGQAFDAMNDFASKVPFSLEEIERASPLLLTVAKNTEELNELLEITGDIAAISGLSFEATAGQLQRSMAGGIAAADLFRERGVKAFLGFKEGVQYTAAQTKDLIQNMWKDGTTTAVGATKELAGTFQGQVSMMQDAWRELKLAIADAGVFEMASKVVLKLTEMLNAEDTKKNMESFGKGITAIGTGLGGVYEGFMAMPEWVRNTGLIMAFLGGRRAQAVLAVLSLVALAVKKITTEMEDLDAVSQRLNSDAGITEEAFNRFGVKSQKVALDTSDAFKDLNETIIIAGETVSRFGKKDGEDTGNTVLDEVLNKVVTLDDVFDRFDKAQYVIFDDRQIQSMEHAERVITELHEGYRDLQPVLGATGEGIEKITNHMDRNSMTSIRMAINIQKIADEAELAKEKVKEFADGMATNIEDSIMRMTQGLMSFKDVVRSVFQYVAMEIVRANIAKPLASGLSGLISGAIGGFATGTGGGGLSSLLSGKDFATGGRPPVGQASLVGERGAEMFVPDRAGTIVPNNQMGGQTINVTYSPQINALDPRTAQSVIAENAPTIVAAVRQAFNQNGQEVAI